LSKTFLSLLFAFGFVAAGGLSAVVVAATTTATTSTAPTTTAGSTTTPPPPAVLPDGVTIAGVSVGGLTPEGAQTAVRMAFTQPLELVVAKRRFRPRPERLGAVPYVAAAVSRAQTAAPGSAVPLVVAIRGRATRAYVAALARRVDRKPVDARISLRRLRPWLTKERPGRALDRPWAVRRIVRELRANRRGPLTLRVLPVRPAVRRADFGPVIVIRRESHRLFLYRGMRFWRVFGIAVGQPAYPTPLGSFSIAVMWRDPWWYPPNSSWAAGASPIPPGPGNPLGTRWMGLTAPGVGIHGTPDAASIGYSASHGCIRMHISEAEWLFAHVRVGTPVFIVSA
jgi:lipoprotein-anchoring transpeptidase ErfK/SrfK